MTPVLGETSANEVHKKEYERKHRGDGKDLILPDPVKHPPRRS